MDKAVTQAANLGSSLHYCGDLQAKVGAKPSLRTWIPICFSSTSLPVSRRLSFSHNDTLKQVCRAFWDSSAYPRFPLLSIWIDSYVISVVGASITVVLIRHDDGIEISDLIQGFISQDGHLRSSLGSPAGSEAHWNRSLGRTWSINGSQYVLSRVGANSEPNRRRAVSRMQPGTNENAVSMHAVLTKPPDPLAIMPVL